MIQLTIKLHDATHSELKEEAARRKATSKSALARDLIEAGLYRRRASIANPPQLVSMDARLAAHEAILLRLIHLSTFSRLALSELLGQKPGKGEALWKEAEDAVALATAQLRPLDASPIVAPAPVLVRGSMAKAAKQDADNDLWARKVAAARALTGQDKKDRR